jgi:hypothetical protein
MRVDWQQEGRRVGSQNFTVVAALSGTMLEVLQEMQRGNARLAARLDAVEQGQAADRVARLRNCVAQMLLHACGEQTFRTSRCDYFGRMSAAQDPQLQQLAQSMGMATTAEVARQADGVITRRNQHIHPGSKEALDSEVSALQGLITPALEQMCPQECRFLRAYGDVKGAFPTRFG